MSYQRRPIAAIREQKAALINILLTAILFALGFNLLTAYLSAQLRDLTAVLLGLAVVVLLLAALLIKTLVGSRNSQVIRLRGALAFDLTHDDIRCVKIIGYPFNDEMCEYLGAFLRENKAYARLFHKADSGEVHSGATFDPNALDRDTMINSVLEFAVLHKLDLHLNTYFVENEIDRSRITTISRDQLGPAVLKNRVIDLITRDMKEREAFIRDSEEPSEGIVCMAEGKDGAIYERLDIELPPKSRIRRDSRGHLVISSKLFDLTIWPQFEGYGTTIPQQFMPSKTDYFTPLLISVKLLITVKNRALFGNDSIEMYEWLDSFIEELEDYISTDRLQQRLDTDMIELMTSHQRVGGNRQRRKP